MARNMARFSIDQSDMRNLEEKIKQLPGIAEGLINNFLYTDGAEIIAVEVSSLIRRSSNDEKKPHAKDVKWWATEEESLGVLVKSRGGAANKPNSYGYLVFPDEGRGPRNEQEQDFSGRGLERATPIIVERLGSLLSDKIQEVL